jgi:hypothetical protein
MDWSLIAVSVFFVGTLCLLGIMHIVEFIDCVRNFRRDVRKRPELVIALIIIITMCIVGSPPVRDRLFAKPNAEAFDSLDAE